MSEVSEVSERKILCVGMCVLDIVHVCEEFPVEDQDKRCLSGRWQRGGNASNNCTVLRLLGANCEFLGMMSDEEGFQFLAEDCRKRGIELKNCPRTAQDPPLSSIILTVKTGSRSIIHSNPDFPILTFEHFKLINLNEYDWIHFEARNPGETLQMIHMILDYCKQAGRKITISLDLEKLRTENFVLMPFVDYIILGKDLAKFMGWPNKLEAVQGLRAKIVAEAAEANNNIPQIICPWGSKGVATMDAEGKVTEIDPVRPAKVVDSLGAGDTFCAATIYAMNNLKYSLVEAAQFGNRVASYKIQYHGYDAIEQMLGGVTSDSSFDK